MKVSRWVSLKCCFWCLQTRQVKHFDCSMLSWKSTPQKYQKIPHCCHLVTQQPQGQHSVVGNVLPANLTLFLVPLLQPSSKPPRFITCWPFLSVQGITSISCLNFFSHGRFVCLHCNHFLLIHTHILWFSSITSAPLPLSSNSTRETGNGAAPSPELWLGFIRVGRRVSSKCWYLCSSSLICGCDVTQALVSLLSLQWRTVTWNNLFLS